MRVLFLILVACCLAGCASRSEIRAKRQQEARLAGNAHGGAWPLAALVARESYRVGLLGPNGERLLTTSHLRHAWSAATRIQAVVDGVRPEFIVIGMETVNAFALRYEDRNLIGITVGMVDLIGDDESAWAALIGHELAHINLRHQEGRRQRHQDTEVAGALANFLLLIIGVPLAPLLTDAAGAVAEKGYSRDDERGADEVGIGYMRLAGYSPEGAVRLFEKLGGANGDSGIGFLSTHPAGAERIAAARALAEAANVEAAPSGVDQPFPAHDAPESGAERAP